jgi:hypothetical protein
MEGAARSALYVFGGFVAAQPEKHRMPHCAFAREVGELYLRHQLRLDPFRAARGFTRHNERRFCASDLAELLRERRERLVVEASADIAAIHQFSVLAVRQHQRRKLRDP